MHRLDPDLTRPQSLEQALWLCGRALNSGIGSRSLPSSEDLVSELEGLVGRLSSSLLRKAQTEPGGHYRGPRIATGKKVGSRAKR